MDIRIDFSSIDQLFQHAEDERRDFLFEYEVYELLRRSGSESPPQVQLLQKGMMPSDRELSVIPGDKIVVKIVSPTIVHKSEVVGVKIIDNNPTAIRSTWRRMMYEVPEHYAAWIERHRESAPLAYAGLRGEFLQKTIARDIKGVILCQYMPSDSQSFGNEMIVGIRRTREFGMIISAGLGGTDTELYAQRFRKSQAVVAASTDMTDGQAFFEMFRRTISYQKLAGLTRGQKRSISDEQLLECFCSFIAMANHYSPSNPNAPFVIEELEINPFAFSDYAMIPLDGHCKFSKPQQQTIPRPIDKIDKLLHPSSIGVIGVSSKRMNVGRIILQNILANGFEPSNIRVIGSDAQTIDGVICLPDLSALSHKLDLLVISVEASLVPELVDTIIARQLAEAVLLIPGGLGETTGSAQRGLQLKTHINQTHQQHDGGPVFIGGNSLGIISHPGHYDTLFIPEAKLPKHRGNHKRNSAFISQSGAYMITRMSKISSLDPAYALSIGNQIDLTAGDLLKYIKDLPDIEIIAIYMEGFADLDGLAFTRAVREATLQGKQIIFYKAGRTPEGKTATSGHTASLAGDYMVCESCMREAGALVAQTFTEFEDLFRLASCLHDKKFSGNRLAAVSNAGYESVGIADNILGEDYVLEIATFSDLTRQKLSLILSQAKLDKLVDVKNPLDINPLATDAVHEAVIQTLLEDHNVDAIVAAFVPLSPVLQTLPDEIFPYTTVSSDTSIARRLPKLIAKYDKPVVAVVDSGKLYDPLAEALEDADLAVFRSADRAAWSLGKYLEGRLHAEQIRNQ